MALIQDFTDLSGVTHTQAHFRCVQINIGAADKSIALTFYGYKDLPSFGSGKQPLVGAQKSYVISGAEFMAVAMAAPSGATLYAALANAAETHALATLDVDSGEVDSSGNPIKVSFFQNATQV